MRKLLMAILLTATVAGCFGSEQDDGDEVVDPPVTDPFLATPPTFFVNDVGEQGPEPSIRADSSGAIYYQALEKTMKSVDGGQTWTNVNSPLALPTTLDPYLWLDPATDRVFANQLYVACSYLTFTDDGGATWLANPAACGTPV